MKRILILILILSAPSLARAQLVFLNGGTNNVAAATTNSYTGVTGVIGTARMLTFSLTAQYLGGSGANAGTTTATFDSSTDGSNWKLGVFTITLTLAGTSASTALSTIDSGGVTAWRLSTLGNPHATLPVTNVVLNVGYKPGDSGNMNNLTAYTTANLWSAAPTNLVAFCTDCMTPQGTGGVVYNDGTYWRLQGNAAPGILATTTNLDYCRSWAAHSPVMRLSSTYEEIIDGSPSATQSGSYALSGTSGTGAAVNSTSGATTNQIGNSFQVAGPTANSGYCYISPLTKSESFKVQNCAFGYGRVDHYVDTSPDSTHAYSAIIGFSSGHGSTTPYASFIGYLYDSTNTYGFNATTLNRAQSLVTAGAGLTNWIFATEAPSKTSSSWDTVEILAEPGQVTFYTNGVLQATVAIGSYYPTNTLLGPIYQVTTASAGNTAATTLSIPRHHWHIRALAPYKIPFSGTVYP